jgi:hypothetical protein
MLVTALAGAAGSGVGLPLGPYNNKYDKKWSDTHGSSWDGRDMRASAGLAIAARSCVSAFKRVEARNRGEARLHFGVPRGVRAAARGYSSVGRAPGSHPGGRGFESP